MSNSNVSSSSDSARLIYILPPDILPLYTKSAYTATRNDFPPAAVWLNLAIVAAPLLICIGKDS